MAKSPAPLSVDLKRQVLYAALLRFSGEAQHLRNRALDRLILAALSDSSSDQPRKIGEVQKLVSLGAVDIRIEVITEALRRLEKTEFVEHKWVRLKRAYFLSERGQAEIRQAANSSGQLMEAVITRTMRDLPTDLAITTAGAVFRTFLCECFARLGLEIAKTVTGRIDRNDLLRMPQIAAAFKTGCQGHELSKSATESLEARCAEFLRSTNPDDEQLKLYLTQGFFFTQLLGMQQGATFDPLAEEAFSGAVLYFDTNTLLPLLLQRDAHDLFTEMATIARGLGIELRVTRATLDEIRRVAADRKRQLEVITQKGIPDELLQRSADQFLEAYMEQQDAGQASLDRLFAPFDHLSDFVREQLGMTLVDMIEEQVLDGRADEAHSVGVIIQEESETIRHHRKRPATLNHDVAHMVLVRDERTRHRKTWFLTRDRSLIQAAARLSDRGQPPLCFSMTGFLQTISPFITATSVERSLADVFSSMLTDQFSAGNQIYDLEELVVLADLHEDVLATRDERLVQAIDAVRSHALQGRPFTAENAQRAALELKKFLASSVSERERAAIGERERLRGVIEDGAAMLDVERRSRAAAEGEAEVLRGQVDDLAAQVSTLRKAEADKALQISSLDRAVEALRRRSVRNQILLVTIIGLALVVWDTSVAGVINANVRGLEAFWTYLHRGVRAVGLLLAGIPLTSYVRGTGWPIEYQAGLLTALFACLYALLPGVTDRWGVIFEDPFVWIALVVSIVLATRNRTARRA